MSHAEKDSKPTARSSTRSQNARDSLQVALPCSDSLEIPAPQADKRDVSQVTLSTIADVSVAASAAMDRVADVRQGTRWLPLVGFFFLVYLAVIVLTIETFDAAPWVRAFLVPLFPVGIATIAFWWWQRWKLRSQASRFQLKMWTGALNSLRHEAANAVNALRVNLIAFRMANPEAALPEHLEQVELATRRIEQALEKAQNRSAGEKK
jgi:hypothetical protein